jgi:glutathione peroxidase
MSAMRALLAFALFLAAGQAAAACAPLLDLSYRPLAGKAPVHLCEAYAGKVLLVVNTASKCGFTPQYEGLEALHQELGGRGFAVIGFPSNDFMGQEPGSEEEIKDFCTNTYGVKFPMFEKVVVRGKDATPLYAKLAEATGEAPGWNFHKYLIDREGKVVASFGSRTKPDDAALREKIESLLAAAPATGGEGG